MAFTRRNLVRVISYMSALLVVAAGFAGAFLVQSRVYTMRLNNEYKKAFDNLATYVSDIDFDLRKSAYANTPSQIVSLSTQICKTSGEAKESLSSMPYYAAQLDGVSKFLTQTGDYMFYISKSIAAGNKFSNEQRQTVSKLSDIATTISTHIISVQSEVLNGNIKIQKLNNDIKQSLSTSENIPVLTKELSKIESDVGEFPTLIYDGPFSDHGEKTEAALTKGKEEVSASKAMQIASIFLSVDVQSLSQSEASDGAVPSYFFNCGTKNIRVSKFGGYVVDVLDSRAVTNKNISPQQAVDNAKKILENNGFPNMKETYYFEQNNTLIINFAYMQNNVIVYPDLIKVGIALDDGSLSVFDAIGYVMNHVPVRDTKATISVETAKSKIYDQLKVQSTRLAIIPTPGKYEQLCYEIHCIAPDANELLIYVDAKTGQESQILILLYSDNGTLTQ